MASEKKATSKNTVSKKRLLREIRGEVDRLEASDNRAEQASCVCYIMIALIKLYNHKIKNERIVEMLSNIRTSNEDQRLQCVIFDKDATEYRLKKMVFDLLLDQK